jgi:hypothetical protein
MTILLVASGIAALFILTLASLLIYSTFFEKPKEGSDDK